MLWIYLVAYVLGLTWTALMVDFVLDRSDARKTKMAITVMEASRGHVE
jgi:hypothetical protein